MFLTGIFALLSNLLFFSGYVKNKNCFPKPLSPEKEKELLDKIAEGDKSARDDLIRHNMRLVVHIVKKYTNYGDNDELISVGSIGLIKAVNSYHEGKGTQFATYASRCIENEILMVIRANKKYKNTKSLYEPVSFDKDGNEVALIDLIGQDEESVITKVESKIVQERLLKVAKKVPDEREYEIIMLRYGINRDKAYTQNEVADKYEISRSYVSRIEKKALFKLKMFIEDYGLQF